MASKGINLSEQGAAPLAIGQILAFHAEQDPGRPAVTFDDVTISYAELDARSNRRARQFAALGVKEGGVVTVAVPNSHEFYETVFAVWKLGATVNNVSSRLPAAELRAVVELAKPNLIVGEESARVAGWDFLATSNTPAPELPSEPLPVKVANPWKIATSGGSTGRPKLIVDKKPGLFDPNQLALDQLPGETMLNPGPLYHNTPFISTIHSLFAGNHVVEMGRFDPVRALELIERYKINWVSLVPTMMSRIWRLPEPQRNSFDVSSLRTVWHMASVCPNWLKQAWIDWLGPDKIFELYGGTELVGVTVITGREWLDHKGSVGRPLSGKMAIFDEAGKECQPGEIGEIYFLAPEGAGPTSEYIGAEAKSRDGWLTYGDLGHVDADGYLYIADRRTDMIVSGGANIFPAEVEAALDHHPDVQSSIVIGLPDPDLGQRAHAVIQMTEDARTRTGDDALRGFLADRLARYKIPRTFEYTLDDLRDDAGKARRTKMRDDRAAGTT